MIIFAYTFATVFLAIVLILGVGGLLADIPIDDKEEIEGMATASMCTTQLLEKNECVEEDMLEDFVIEQDMVYTYDSINI